MSEAGQPAQERWEKSPRRLTISLNKRRVVERDKSFNDYQHGRLHIRDGDVFLPDPSGKLRFVREATADDYVQARDDQPEHESDRPTPEEWNAMTKLLQEHARQREAGLPGSTAGDRPTAEEVTRARERVHEAAMKAQEATPEEPCVNCGHDARDHRMLETDEVCSECGHSCEYLETDRPTPEARCQCGHLARDHLDGGLGVCSWLECRMDGCRDGGFVFEPRPTPVAGDGERWEKSPQGQHHDYYIRSVEPWAGMPAGHRYIAYGVSAQDADRIVADHNAALTAPARETPVDGWWVDKVPGKGNKHVLYHGTESWGASTNADLLHRVAAALNRVPPARETALLEALRRIVDMSPNWMQSDAVADWGHRMQAEASNAIDAYERGAPHA